MRFSAEDFWSQIQKDIGKAMYESSGRRLWVDSVSSGLVRLKDVRGKPAGVAAYLGLEKLYTDQEVWVEPVGNLHVDRNSITALQSWVVVAPIKRTAATQRFLEGTELILVSGMDLSGATDASGATKTWTIDSATGFATFNAGVNTPQIGLLSQGSADTGSTTSTVNYVTAASLDLGLPAGNWNIKALGLLGLKHSNSQGANMLVQIDGVDGGAKTLDCPSATFRLISDNGQQGGIVGNRTIQIKIRYKSSDAGTSTASNPLLFTTAERTS